MEQETELNIHKKKKKALLCSMDVDNCLDFSHKSTRLSTMEIYEADATRNINSFLTADNVIKNFTILLKSFIIYIICLILGMGQHFGYFRWTKSTIK